MRPDQLDQSRYRHLVFKGMAAIGPARAARGGNLPSVRLAPASNHRLVDELSLVGEAELAFLRRVFAMAGLDIGRYRLSPLCRRLPACLRALRCTTLEKAMQQLEEDPAKLVAVLDALVVGVSAFFRDRMVFEHLREQVLPRLLEEQATVRVWSMACSHGAELYSVAMQLAEREALSRAVLYGTDCRAAAIASAMSGECQEEVIRDIPVDLLRRFFVHRGRRYILDPSLRAATRWEVKDAFADGEWGTWDLILCRNLAIYLGAAAAGTLWRRISDALRRGGVLVVGKAEKPSIPSLKQIGPCTYQKT
jgi:chemotaxis protein methyltransferase CheR